MFLFCLVFAMFCARLFICASWSPAGKGLTSWLSFVVSSVSLSLSHWYPGSGVVLDLSIPDLCNLTYFSNRWCKRENVELEALKEWKINIFKIIDTRISFCSRYTHLLPPKPKSSFRHLKRGIQDFHMNYVLVPADKAANNVVVN